MRELTVTLADGAAAPPTVRGEILRRRQRARQWQVLVRYLADEHLDTLRGNPAIAELDARTPSLEEIFVAYLNGGRQESSPAPAQEVAAT